ncbi:ROK family protein [Candidatus Pelagibacter bacterium]|nr:ROK family protein [Candidatus Pelagibacter bacterium]
MQIGIDLGATKIESVLLKENGLELHRDRIQSPKNYQKTISDITNIVKNIEEKFKKNLNVGICHPGSTNLETGFIQNAFNSPWLNNQTFSKDISKSLNRNVYCENDANCFALSEAFDGSAKNFKTVFGIILGSGCGGGLVIDKKIIIGPNSFTGEWGHIPIGKPDSETNIEEYISGKGLERKFTARFNKNLSAHEIFKNAKDNSQDEIEIIDEFKKKLARSLSLIINVIDPDAIVFGGGVSNEIESLDEIKKTTEKYLSNFNNIKNVNLKTIFLKPKFGDASGVRGAAILSKQNAI